MPRKTKLAKPAPNLLEMVPCRVASHRDEEGGLVTVLRPKFISGPLARFLQPYLRRPYYNVHLDEMGSRVWALVDGARTVGDIHEALRAELGEQEQDLDRLAAFLAQLEGGGMIRYLASAQPGPEPDKA